MPDNPAEKPKTVKKYYSTGELSSESTFLGEKAHGTYRWYWRNGKVWTEGHYDHGIRVGTTRIYDHDGVLWEELTYVDRNGSHDSKVFYKNGKLQSEINFRYHATPPMMKNRSFFQRIYYENGQTALEVSLPVGSKETSQTAWDEQGRQLTSEYEIALVWYKTQLNKDRDRLNLIPLGQAALKEGRLAEAKQIANEVAGFLSVENFDRENAMLFLGQIALLNGEIKDAGEYLLLAKRLDPFDRGSTRNDFPDMTLAKGLLEKGKTDVVLRFLDLCSKIYTNHIFEVLSARWIEEIKSGKIPDFSDTEWRK